MKTVGENKVKIEPANNGFRASCPCGWAATSAYRPTAQYAADEHWLRGCKAANGG